MRIILTATQWRNVISGGPRFKIFEGPLEEVPSRAPYMHEFSRESRACSPGKFLNLESLKCHFLDFGERFYRILMPWPMFLLYRLSLGPPLGLGAPGFSRSEPIVVTPLQLRVYITTSLLSCTLRKRTVLCVERNGDHVEGYGAVYLLCGNILGKVM
jgi:hypothetical protein